MILYFPNSFTKKIKNKKENEIAYRRERILKQIQIGRVEMNRAIITLMGPLRSIDRFQLSGKMMSRLFFGFFSITILLIFRFKPSLRTVTSSFLRLLALWRLIRKLRL